MSETMRQSPRTAEEQTPFKLGAEMGREAGRLEVAAYVIANLIPRKKQGILSKEETEILAALENIVKNGGKIHSSQVEQVLDDIRAAARVSEVKDDTRL